MLLVTSLTAEAQLIGGGPRKPKGGGAVDLSGYAVKAANNLFTGSNTFSGTVNYTAPWTDYQASFGSVSSGGRVQFVTTGGSLDMGFTSSSNARFALSTNRTSGELALVASGSNGLIQLIASGTTGGAIEMQAGANKRLRLNTDGTIIYDPSGTFTNSSYGFDIQSDSRVTGTLTVGAGVISSGTIQSASTLRATQGVITGTTSSLDASAILEARSTAKGFLPPRMTATQRAAISSPAVGLLVYQLDAPEGVFVNTSTGWKQLAFVP